MKIIIELISKKSIFGAVKKQIAQAQKEGKSIDYHLGFESARALFSDLTPARIDLLDTLRGMGPSSMYALAKTTNRNHSNIHTDVSRLLELGLIDRSIGRWASFCSIRCDDRRSVLAIILNGKNLRRFNIIHTAIYQR